MSLLVTIPDAQWLTLVPAAGLARRTVGIPEGLWYGTTLLYGDGSGGTLTLFWDTSFAIKDRWVMEWEAVSSWVLHETVQSGVLQVNTGPNVPDPMVTGIQNPSFTQVKLGVAAVGAATQTFDYDLGSGGGRPLLTWGTKGIAGAMRSFSHIWTSNLNVVSYQANAWGYYYSQQGLFRGLPPGQG